MFCFALRVYYDSTDAAAVVYHTEYLKWMEQARTEAFYECGLDLVAWIDQGIAFVVRDLDVHYHKPAALGDKLEVLSVVERIQSASMLWQQRVMCDGVCLAQARVRIACIDGAWKPQRLPQALVEALAKRGGGGT